MKKILATCIAAVLLFCSGNLMASAEEITYYDLKITYTDGGEILDVQNAEFVSEYTEGKSGHIRMYKVKKGDDPKMHIRANADSHTVLVDVKSAVSGTLKDKEAATSDLYELAPATHQIPAGAREDITVTVQFEKHVYGTPKVVAPTCTKDGYTEHTCDVCGSSYTDAKTAATGHRYTKTEVVAPTCTKDGYTKHICEAGDASYVDAKTPAAHTFNAAENKVVAPTCTEEGYTLRKCTACGYEEKIDVKPATGHKYKDEEKAVTCTEDGYTTHTCTVCGNTYTDNYQKATGHALQTAVVQPTKTSIGYTVVICSKCDYIEVTNIQDMLPAVMAGEMYTVGNANYYISSAQEGDRTAIYLGPVNKDIKKAIVPSSVKMSADGNSYKVIDITEGAFSGCANLTSVHIGNGVLRISSRAFENCVKLAKVEIPNTTAEIGSKAFYNCESLTKVTVGTSVSKIGSEAFRNCKKLKVMTIKTKRLSSVGNKAFTGISKTAKIKAPSGKISTYRSMLQSKGKPASVKVTR